MHAVQISEVNRRLAELLRAARARQYPGAVGLLHTLLLRQKANSLSTRRQEPGI